MTIGNLHVHSKLGIVLDQTGGYIIHKVDPRFRSCLLAEREYHLFSILSTSSFQGGNSEIQHVVALGPRNCLESFPGRSSDQCSIRLKLAVKNQMGLCFQDLYDLP